MVKVVEIDSQGRINLSRKAVLGGGTGDDDGAPAPRSEEPAGAGSGDRNGAPRGRGRRPPRRD
jgi:polyribonucleotide nucleotidyltransferase